MRVRSFCVSLALLALAFSALAEPKAYDLVQYRGKAAGLTIAFDFGDGYAEASEIRITPAAGGKTVRFVLNDGEKMRFIPAKSGGDEEEVILKMSQHDAAPEKVEGTYRARGKTIAFRLLKRPR